MLTVCRMKLMLKVEMLMKYFQKSSLDQYYKTFLLFFMIKIHLGNLGISPEDLKEIVKT